MTPLILNAALKDYIWGGTKLREIYGRQGDSDRIAESWELSCHKDGMSVIADGEYKGRTLNEYLRDNPGSLGTNCKRFDTFPVLIKLIDAKDDLSIQVHPDDEYAERIEGEYGKTEMWYIVDCEDDAELIYGLKRKISRDEFADALKNNTVTDIVNRVKVKKGDVFFIKSGTIHSIGKGILVAEIQQNSNTTYRVYDYGRKGKDGRPRELNIEKALDVTCLKPSQKQHIYPKLSLGGKYKGTSVQLIGDCEYFTTSEIKLCNSLYCRNVDEKSFCHFLVLEGKCMLDGTDTHMCLEKGTSLFIPASSGEISLKGNCSMLCTEINQPL